MKKSKKSKFSLEKFEVAKLSGMKNIFGGDGTGDPIGGTDTSKKCDKNLSTANCGDIGGGKTVNG